MILGLDELKILIEKALYSFGFKKDSECRKNCIEAIVFVYSDSLIESCIVVLINHWNLDIDFQGYGDEFLTSETIDYLENRTFGNLYSYHENNNLEMIPS